MPHWFKPSSCALIAALGLAACSTPSGSVVDADAPIFGSRKAQRATFLVSAEGEIGLGELARVAKIIGPYRELSAAEVKDLEARLNQELDRLVEVEFQQMQQEERAARKASPQRRITIAKPTRQAARARLLARLGKDLALPLLTSDNRSAVAFGRISTTGVRVSAKSYEITAPADGPPAAVKEVATPAGGRATLIESALPPR